jgi:hypothetical protein
MSAWIFPPGAVLPSTAVCPIGTVTPVPRRTSPPPAVAHPGNEDRKLLLLAPLADENLRSRHSDETVRAAAAFIVPPP